MVFFINTINSIEQLYEEELREELLFLDVFRKNYRNIILSLWAVIFLLVVIDIAITNFSSFMTGTIISLAIFLYPLIKLWGMNGYAKEEYNLYYKNRIIDRIVNFVEENLEYNSKGGIKQSTFEESMMFSKKIDQYKSQNLIEGIINNRKVFFSEIHAEYEVNSGRNKSYRTIFKGIFLIVELNKKSDFTMIITPHEKYENTNILGDILRFFGLKAQKFELVKIENEEFEEYFTVYSDNVKNTQGILSDELAQKLINIRKIVRKDINISLKDSYIFIGIPLSENIFEIPVFFSIVNIYQIKLHYDILNLITTIVKEIEI